VGDHFGVILFKIVYPCRTTARNKRYVGAGCRKTFGKLARLFHDGKIGGEVRVENGLET
jgi:hypothetical protein